MLLQIGLVGFELSNLILEHAIFVFILHEHILHLFIFLQDIAGQRLSDLLSLSCYNVIQLLLL